MQPVRDINFFARHRENTFRENKTLEKLAVKAGTLGVIVVVCVGGMAIYGIKSGLANREVARIDTFLNSEEVLGKLEDVRIKKQTIETIVQYNGAIESAASRIQSHPKLDREVLTDIESRASQDLLIQSVDYSEGTVSMECTASDHNQIANFVHKLRSSKFIYDVNYTGYQKEGGPEGGTNPSPGAIGEGQSSGPASKGYDASIEIILTPGGGDQ